MDMCGLYRLCEWTCMDLFILSISNFQKLTNYGSAVSILKVRVVSSSCHRTHSKHLRQQAFFKFPHSFQVVSTTETTATYDL